MKTITMMQLRASPGEFAFRVMRDGESYLVTYQGKPCFKMVPVEDVTRVLPDGTIKGPKPLTFGLDLGDEYGECPHCGTTSDAHNIMCKNPADRRQHREN